MEAIHLVARLQQRGPTAAVVLDDARVAEVGQGARRFPVVATVNGSTWRMSVTRMNGEFAPGLSREVREAAGVEVDDEVDVSIDLDKAPRGVEIPEAL